MELALAEIALALAGFAVFVCPALITGYVAGKIAYTRGYKDGWTDRAARERDVK